MRTRESSRRRRLLTTLVPVTLILAVIATFAFWKHNHPARTNEIVISAKSGRASQGVDYDFVLHTHCGLDRSVDFDGSFWEHSETRKAEAAEPRSLSSSPSLVPMTDPFDHGSMTLISRNTAEFHSSNGDSIIFRRRNGVKHLPGMCM